MRAKFNDVGREAFLSNSGLTIPSHKKHNDLPKQCSRSVLAMNHGAHCRYEVPPKPFHYLPCQVTAVTLSVARGACPLASWQLVSGGGRCEGVMQTARLRTVVAPRQRLPRL